MTKRTKIAISHLFHILFLAAIGWCVLFGLDKYQILSALMEMDLTQMIGNVRSMSSTVAQIAAALVGLILAALAMLLSMSNHTLIVNMGVSGHLHLLVGRMLISMAVFMVLACYGLVLMVKPEIGIRQINYLLCFGAISIVSLLEVFRKISRVLWFLSPLTDSDEPEVKVLYEEN